MLWLWWFKPLIQKPWQFFLKVHTTLSTILVTLVPKYRYYRPSLKPLKSLPNTNISTFGGLVLYCYNVVYQNLKNRLKILILAPGVIRIWGGDLKLTEKRVVRTIIFNCSLALISWEFLFESTVMSLSAGCYNLGLSLHQN